MTWDFTFDPAFPGYDVSAAAFALRGFLLGFCLRFFSRMLRPQ